jgi:hypothetical protein
MTALIQGEFLFTQRLKIEEKIVSLSLISVVIVVDIPPGPWKAPVYVSNENLWIFGQKPQMIFTKNV